MNLYKKILLAMASLLLIALVGYAVQQASLDKIKQYADPITENVLTAMNDDDYDRFSQDFNERMKQGVNEVQYFNKVPVIKGKIGDYISKEFVSAETKEKLVTVTYKAKFSKEAADVIIKSTFSDQNGQKVIAGLWLDSPKLRCK